MVLRLGAGAADDDLHPITDGIDEAAVTRGKRDGQQVGIARLAEGEGVAFRMGGEATAKIAVQGFILREIDTGGLAVKADPANASLLAEDGAADLVITVSAGRGGGLGEAESELDPFLFHEWRLFFRDVQAVEDSMKDGR